MSRGSIAILLAFIALGSVTAITDKIVKRDPVTGFPCMGYLTEVNTLFSFKEIHKTIDSADIPQFTWKGEQYTGKVTFSICAEKQVDFSDVECPGMNYTGSAGYFKLNKVSDNSTRCLPIPSALAGNDFDLEGVNSSYWKVHYMNSAAVQNTLIPDFDIKCFGQSFQSNASYVAGNVVGIQIASSNQCGSTVKDLTNFIGYKLRFFTWVLIPLAIFMLFFGIKFIKTVMFIIGFLFGTLFSIMVGCFVVEPQTLLETKTALIILGVSLIVGILLGYLIAKLTKLYLVVAGGFLGYIISFELLRLFASVISVNLGEGTKLGCTIGLILAFAVLGFFIHDHILIISTSIGGGFLLVFAIGTLLRNLPDPVDIIKAYEVDPKTASRYRMYALGYLLSAIVLSILGMCYQYSQRRKRIEEVHGEQGTDGENMDKLYPEYQFYAYNMNYGGSPAYHNANNQYI